MSSPEQAQEVFEYYAVDVLDLPMHHPKRDGAPDQIENQKNLNDCINWCLNSTYGGCPSAKKIDSPRDVGSDEIGLRFNIIDLQIKSEVWVVSKNKVCEIKSSVGFIAHILKAEYGLDVEVLKHK